MVALAQPEVWLPLTAWTFRVRVPDCRFKAPKDKLGAGVLMTACPGDAFDLGASRIELEVVALKGSNSQLNDVASPSYARDRVSCKVKVLSSRPERSGVGRLTDGV